VRRPGNDLPPVTPAFGGQEPAEQSAEVETPAVFGHDHMLITACMAKISDLSYEDCLKNRLLLIP
jgi:hypothetical protein